MHTRTNWDDMRFVLAVAQSGSVSAAARLLGVNHATVLRRVSAFEQAYGIEVFDKTATGYDIGSDRLRIVDAVREVEAAVMSVERAVRGVSAPVQGVVRVTSTDTFCQAILPPVVADIHRSAEGLCLELLSNNIHLDLGRLHADIAVRPTDALPEELRGEIAAQLAFDVYAAPETPDRWLSQIGALARSVPARWMADNVAADLISGASDSFVTLREMAAAGVGQVILPAVLGDSDPRLERRTGIAELDSVPIWVASHADLSDAPRIRAVRVRLTAGLRAVADRLAPPGRR